MDILSPTSVTSNKICQWPIAQQVIALAMLHKIYSLFKSAIAYVQAKNQKIRVTEQHAGGIQSALDALNIEKTLLTEHVDRLGIIQRREHLKPRDNFDVPTQAEQEASDAQNLAQQTPYQTLIEIRSKSVADCQKIYFEKIAALQADLKQEDVKIEAARVKFQADKDYLKVAAKRMIPLWGTLVSYQALKDLKKASPAA